jgi:hypothetical protein
LVVGNAAAAQSNPASNGRDSTGLQYNAYRSGSSADTPRRAYCRSTSAAPAADRVRSRRRIYSAGGVGGIRAGTCCLRPEAACHSTRQFHSGYSAAGRHRSDTPCRPGNSWDSRRRAASAGKRELEAFPVIRLDCHQRHRCRDRSVSDMRRSGTRCRADSNWDSRRSDDRADRCGSAAAKEASHATGGKLRTYIPCYVGSISGMSRSDDRADRRGSAEVAEALRP